MIGASAFAFSSQWLVENQFIFQLAHRRNHPIFPFAA
jgi:hypothetical protein